MEAIAGRSGYVGGIEYIVVDGVTWLFGFSYSDDLVLSPLFDEPHEMAAFAAAHMRQLTRGGPDVVHDAAYWAELIEESEGESGLADPENCVFTPEALQALPAWTGSVRDSNRIAAPLAFEYHLSYLLNAAIGEDRTVELTALQELDRLGLDYQPDEVGTQCLHELVAMATGEDELPESASPRDLAVALQDSVDATLKALPANWGAVLAALSSQSR
jgi:hypothetical protein